MGKISKGLTGPATGQKPRQSSTGMVMSDMTAALLTLIACASLGACDGPNEIKGRAADQAMANAAGRTPSSEGPNERLGEAQDRAEKAETDARDAKADALESEAEKLRTQADIAADRLEAEAEAVRAVNSS